MSSTANEEMDVSAIPKNATEQHSTATASDDKLSKSRINNNNNTTNRQSAAASDAAADPALNLEDPQNSFAPFLEEKAQKLLAEEKWKEALNAREHVLRCYLRAFGEQSNEANLQKQLLSALILKAGDYEKRSKEEAHRVSKYGAGAGLNTSSTAGSVNTSHHASSSSSPSSSDFNSNNTRSKNLLSSMFGTSPVGDLTMSSRLEYAQMLLAPISVGPMLSEDPNLRHLRARLMVAHSTITAKLNRPRSAIPMLTEAMRLLQGLIQDTHERENDEYAGYGSHGENAESRKAVLSPANHEAARLELCECYLTKAVLLSNCTKHEEALATAMWGLAAILQLEEESWKNFQDLHGRDPNAPRARIFHASLQAACHHNIGAEQEHLGLTELALDSYETGFELAVSCFGIQHPMSERLKTCYSELFSSLHYKHFVKNGEQREVARQALKEADIAISHLRASYYASERHRAALNEQTRKQTRILSKAGTDSSLVKSDPNTTSVSSVRRSTSRTSSRATSAKKRRNSSSRQRPMTATPQL